MVRNNKTCILCGNKYSYCSGCAEFDHLPRWMECYCSENCKDIFNILSSYNMNHKTKEEAKALLEKCDLTMTDTYSEFNKNCINSIMTDKISTLDETTADETIKPVATAGQITIVGEPIMNIPEPLPETTVTVDESIIETNKVSDPVMGDTAVKQSKRMKYTKKK
ncbi:hypothetical protein [Blautia intestinalis]|uniref:hypothetical protein n=1 Tax=Blautia intestinalis TaxID=2763028 RepID=UPI0022E9464B|nr:hypothetical protein [Blautia intestinalis]